MSKSDGKRRIFLETAEHIGQRLCENAFWHDSKCNWMGRSLNDPSKSPPSTRALSGDIYEGTSGISIFLSNLYNCSRNDEFKKTAEGAMNHAIFRIGDISSFTKFGFYTGGTGIAYTSLKLGESLKNNQLIQKGYEIIARYMNDNISDHLLDVISGNASAIPVLLEYYNTFGEEKMLNLAILLGDELIEKATQEKLGWSWDSRSNGVLSCLHNLTGFAHGAAGVGYSLLELYDITKDHRYLNAARQAFKYEDQWFDKSLKNWPDFRIDDQNPIQSNVIPYAMGWCHGAPGIGLSRLRAYQLLSDDSCRDDSEASLSSASLTAKNIIDMNKPSDFSLCHGLAGIGELLLYGSEILKEKSYLSLACNIGEYGIAKYADPKMPWPCGTRNGELPGLLLGLAGIGNFYMRLCDPANVETPLIVLPCR